MNEYEAYQLYLGLKLHLTSDSYDFTRFNGKTTATVDSYEKRHDRLFFRKLAKRKDPVGFLTANLIDGKLLWIGDMLNVDGEDIYQKWLKRKQSLSYTFKQDLSKLDDKFVTNLVMRDGKAPRLLQLYNRGKICVETLVIVHLITDCLSVWDKQIDDTLVWPELSLKLRKYGQLLDIDLKKFKQILKDHFLRV